MSAICPECEGSPDLPPGERCYLCNAKSKRVDGARTGKDAATASVPTGKSSSGTKAGVAGQPRPKVPAKKRKKSSPKRRRRTRYPSWIRAIVQPALAIGAAGCVVHITSLLIGS